LLNVPRMHRLAWFAILLAPALAGASGAAQPPRDARPRSWVPLSALKQAAHRAGVDAIFRAWQGFVTSTTGETYPVYYGRHWDKANAPRNQPQLQPQHAAPAKDETQKLTAPDPARLAKLSSEMVKTATGRGALDLMTQHKVGVEFAAGSAAGYFHRGRNVVVIGAQRPDTDAVNTLIHELTHAGNHHAGRYGRYSMTRQGYIDASLLDEATADARVAQAGREFARINRRAAKTGLRAHVDVVDTTKLYLEAYKKVIFAGRAARLGQGAAPAGVTTAGVATAN
jgi:hypothetical protein